MVVLHDISCNMKYCKIHKLISKLMKCDVYGQAMSMCQTKLPEFQELELNHCRKLKLF